MFIHQYIIITPSDVLLCISVQESYRKTTEVIRPCEETERGAHSEKNVRCGHREI